MTVISHIPYSLSNIDYNKLSKVPSYHTKDLYIPGTRNLKMNS